TDFLDFEHKGDINHSFYDLEADRDGGSSNRYPLLDFRNGHSYSLRYCFANIYINGFMSIIIHIDSDSINNILATFSTTGNIETAVFLTPIIINDGGLVITINSLKRDIRTNESENTYRNTSEVNLHLGGSYTGTVSVTKTFNKREVLIKGPASGAYTPISANVNDIYYPNNADGNMYS